jgi:hypothetical protein
VKAQPNPDAELAYLRASSLRKRTNASYRDASVQNFLAAFVIEEIGRIAIDAAGLASRVLNSCATP